MAKPAPSTFAPPRTLAAWHERMVPGQADALTETLHWQRYVFFRPWYEHRHVLDAGSGDGYGLDYASVYAQSAVGYDHSEEAVRVANEKYPHARFVRGDVRRIDYDGVDVVLAIDVLECIEDHEDFLARLAASQANVAIATPNRLVSSPGRGPFDRPRNRYRVREFTPSEFEALVRKYFSDRPLHFFSQSGEWPGRIEPGLRDDAVELVAAIGELSPPRWPSIGFAVPTHANAHGAADSLLALSRAYPGRLEVAWVLNGVSDDDQKKAYAFAEKHASWVHLVELPQNTGFAGGANAGLRRLREMATFDFFGVANDDIIPALDCLAEMVGAMENLRERGLRPGVIGPVSNCVNGMQQVDIGEFRNYREMLKKAAVYHRRHALSVTEVQQVRGLFMLFASECLDAVGGFDPRFGIGNFEDDDHNVRTALAGFTLWVANGAFLYHEGSKTFRTMNVDYPALIQTNAQRLCEKWRLANVDELWQLEKPPVGVALFQSFEPVVTPTSPEPRPKRDITEPTSEPAVEPSDTAPAEIELNEPRREVAARAFIDEHEGRSVDLIHQLSDDEFGRWVAARLAGHPRSHRLSVIHTVLGATMRQPVEETISVDRAA